MSKRIMAWVLAFSFLFGAAGLSRTLKAADEGKPAAVKATDEGTTPKKQKHHKKHKKPASEAEAAPAK